MVNLLEKQLFAIQIDKEKYENLRALYTDRAINNAKNHIKRTYSNFIIRSKKEQEIEKQISEILDNTHNWPNESLQNVLHPFIEQHNNLINIRCLYDYDYSYEDYYNMPSCLLNIFGSQIIEYNNQQFKVYYHIFQTDPDQEEIDNDDYSIIAEPIIFESISIRIYNND